MAMRLRQIWNDADNAHICAYMREYSRIYADMRIADMCIDLHRKKVAHGYL